MSAATPTQVESPTTRSRPRIVVPGLLAAVVAAAATTLFAAVAGAAGVDFEVPDGAEAIPLSGFTVVTFVLSMVGVAGAVALRRWTRRPATIFLWTAVVLTALSVVPSIFGGENAATAAALVAAHLLAAAIVIPVLVTRLAAGSEANH